MIGEEGRLDLTLAVFEEQKKDNVISSPLICTANGESLQVVTHLWAEPRL